MYIGLLADKVYITSYFSEKWKYMIMSARSLRSLVHIIGQVNVSERIMHVNGLLFSKSRNRNMMTFMITIKAIMTVRENTWLTC